ncbi:hypothetical protein V8F44DRAFT_634922 [Aspergillus fumigatus]
MSSVSEKGQEGHLQQHSVYRRLCEDVDKLTSFLSLVRKKRPLFYLPECPLHDIFELLQPLFFDLFGSVLKGEEFRFPRLLHNRIPRHCLKKPEILQNQLLLQLEDAGWRLCGKCLRLYPRREVSMSLLRSLSTKTINDLRRAPDDAVVKLDRWRYYTEQGKLCLLHNSLVWNLAHIEAKLHMMFFLGEFDTLVMHYDGFVGKSYNYFCDTWANVTPLPANQIIVDVRRMLGSSDWSTDPVWLKQCWFVLEETYSKRMVW